MNRRRTTAAGTKPGAGGKTVGVSEKVGDTKVDGVTVGAEDKRA